MKSMMQHHDRSIDGRRSVWLALSACVIAVVGFGFSVVPANAAYTDCAKGYACLWTGESYPGSPNGSFYSSLVLGSANNKINSIVNNGNSQIAYFYDNADHTGPNISLNNPARGGQWRDPRLSNGTDAQPGYWANKISSAHFR